MKTAIENLLQKEHHGLIYRTFGADNKMGLIGCGFLHKNGGNQEINRGYGHYVAVYVISGKGTYIDHTGKEYPLQSGSVFQRIPDQAHSIIIDDSEPWYECFIALKYYKLEDPDLQAHFSDWVTNDWIREIDQLPDQTFEYLEHMNVVQRQNTVINPGIQRHLISRLELVYSQIKTASQNKVQQLHFQLLSILNELFVIHAQHFFSNHDEEIIGKVCNILTENISSRTSLPELMADIPLSYSALRKTFKKMMGTSIGNYQIYLRIDKANELLQQGKSVKQVAEQLGYDNYSAFSTQYKKITGNPPSTSRKNK